MTTLEPSTRWKWMAWLELGAVSLIAPFLMFPQLPWTVWLLPVVPLVRLARCVTQSAGRTPAGGALLLLLIAAPVGFMASYDPFVSFPKLAGILLGVAVYHAMVHGVRSPRALGWAVCGLVIGGVAVSLVSLVGTNWAVSKLPALQPIYLHLPTLLRGVPRAEQGFSPNEVGGTLTLFVPFMVGLLVYGVPRQAGRRWVSGLLLALACALTLGVLILTQSRLAIATTALALIALGLLGGRRARVVALVAILACLIGACAAGPDELARWLFRTDELGELSREVSWAGRVEIWDRSVHALMDHPFTGVGLDTLPYVVNARYPLFSYPRDYYFTHAHNIYLQVALDLGILGFAGYAWLLATVGKRLWQAWRRPAPAWLKAMTVSLMGGLLAYQAYGLADAITLGAKPGVFWWALLAIAISTTSLMEAT